MTKKAYDKIAGGLTEALEHVNNMPAEKAMHPLEAARGLEDAMRVFSEREKAYIEVMPIIVAYKDALENMNRWRAAADDARTALIKAMSAEALARGRDDR